MTQRIFATLVLLFVLLTNLQCSNKRKSMEPNTTFHSDSCCYTIGEYQICPHQKMIKTMVRVGGVDWDGFEYVPLKGVDFNHTEMYMIGNAILFKEQLLGKDLTKAHFIHPKKYQMNYSGIPIIAFDNDSVYQVSLKKLYPLVAIHDKKLLRDDIFEDNDGKLYILNNSDNGLSEQIPDSLGVDKTTIRNLADNFYYDKDKIYYLGYYVENENNRPVSRFAKTIAENRTENFSVGTSYFTIGNQVYLRSKYEIVKIPDINASLVKEYLLDSYYSTYLITDGNRIYIYSLHYQGTDFKEISDLQGLQLHAVYPISMQWKYNTKTQMAYLKEPPKSYLDKTITGRQGLLMYSWTNGKAFIIDREGEYISLHGILLPDRDGQPERVFDGQSDENIIQELIPSALYRFNNIFYDALLTAYKAHGIDNDKIAPIGNGKYYTDGQHLILMPEILRHNNDFGAEGVAHIEYCFEDWICPINNPANLKMINENLLTDGTTLYYTDYRGKGGRIKLMAVPFSDLGIPVFYLGKGKDKIDTN